MNLPIEILIDWGIIYTGRIHPIESEIVFEHFNKNPGNLILLGGYRDGFLALICAKIFSDYQFHIVEPIQEYVKNLQLNLEINDIKNVKIHECAIGSYDGYTDFDINESETQIKKPKNQKNDNRFNKYQINKLSSLIAKKKIENIKYIIIDIENAETLAIQNSVEYGIRFILFETYDISTTNYNTLKNYEKKGYNFFEINKNQNNFLKKIENYHQFSSSEFFNYLLIKND